jgi:hypothetical protein
MEKRRKGDRANGGREKRRKGDRKKLMPNPVSLPPFFCLLLIFS